MHHQADVNMRNEYNLGGARDVASKPSSAVADAQHGLDENTNRLHGILSELEQRLQPVLGPSKPMGVGEKGPAPNSLSVAARIRESAAHVNGAVSRIEEILSRLEV